MMMALMCSLVYADDIDVQILSLSRGGAVTSTFVCRFDVFEFLLTPRIIFFFKLPWVPRPVKP